MPFPPLGLSVAGTFIVGNFSAAGLLSPGRLRSILAGGSFVL